MESGTDTVRSDTTCNRPYSKRTLSAEHYTGYHSAESDMDLSPTEDGKDPFTLNVSINAAKTLVIVLSLSIME